MIQPPTDNLYKFCSLSGLIVCLFSIYYPAMQLAEREQKLFEIKSELIEIDAEVKFLQEKQQRFENLVDNSIQDQNITEKFSEKKAKTHKDKLDLYWSNDEVKTAFEELFVIKKEITIKNAKVGLKNEQLLEAVHELNLIAFLSFLGSVMGLLASFFGFYKWYTKVQIHMDNRLEKDAKSP